MTKIDLNSMPRGRSENALGAITAARYRRAGEMAASRRQLIKHLRSADFCRPRF